MTFPNIRIYYYYQQDGGHCQFLKKKKSSRRFSFKSFSFSYNVQSFKKADRTNESVVFRSIVLNLSSVKLFARRFNENCLNYDKVTLIIAKASAYITFI